MSTSPLRSESLDKFMPAFLEAQAAMDPVEKNATNSHLNTRYADLAAVRAACLPPLNSNAIAVVQTVIPRLEEPPLFFETTKARGGQTYKVTTQVLAVLRTELVHESGQYVASEIPLATAWGEATAVGATISYMRRYALATICGLVQADDDGQSARGAHDQHDQRPRQRFQRPAPQSQPEDHWDETETTIRHGDRGYQDNHQTQERRDDRAQRKAEYNRAFSKPKPAAPAPPPRLPDFGKRGFYGWIQAADVDDPDRTTAAWFRDHGERNDYPKQFIQWSDDQIFAAYNAYQAIPVLPNGQ